MTKLEMIPVSFLGLKDEIVNYYCFVIVIEMTELFRHSNNKRETTLLEHTLITIHIICTYVQCMYPCFPIMSIYNHWDC